MLDQILCSQAECHESAHPSIKSYPRESLVHNSNVSERYSWCNSTIKGSSSILVFLISLGSSTKDSALAVVLLFCLLLTNETINFNAKVECRAMGSLGFKISSSMAVLRSLRQANKYVLRKSSCHDE